MDNGDGRKERGEHSQDRARGREMVRQRDFSL
jgi:hypothetical protein